MDEFANKLIASKLIAYNGKMSANNTIKLKSLECLSFQICNVDAQIIESAID
jgi:hypothetical protein